MELEDSELYWTRKSKGLVNEKETERYIKELEKQVNKLKDKIDKLENADLTTVYMSGFYDGEKKWKDKIKEKIEELEKIIQKEEEETCGRCITIGKWEAIKYLQELLQEGDK